MTQAINMAADGWPLTVTVIIQELPQSIHIR